MNIGIHQDIHGKGHGGGDTVVAVMAQALAAEGHSVELIHHWPGGYRDSLAAFTGLSLAGVRERYAPRWPSAWLQLPDGFWRLGASMRERDRELSEGYDGFVTSTGRLPPFSHAACSMFYLHFPMQRRVGEWPWTGPRPGLRWLKDTTRKRTYDRLWEECLAGYQLRVVNSSFTARWTRDYWGIDTDILYPPVLPVAADRPKRNLIVNLGRFAPMKRQVEAVAAFREIAPHLPGWELWCVGAVTEADRGYFREVEGLARSVPGVRVIADATREEVGAVLGEAKLFWHLAGLNVDQATEPEKLEHFGIATCEAMAAGAVPLVIDAGGQPEIVQDGESGLLCPDLDRLKRGTVELATSPGELTRMAQGARSRAKAFSADAFRTRLSSLLCRWRTSGRVSV
jgi:L-malate glycosyltransferase